MAAARLTKGDVEKMVGHLARLWTFAIDHAEEGDLSHLGARAIATAAGWQRRPQTFVDVLLEVGLLDPDLRIHNWETHAGRLLDQRRADRERKKRDRRARRGSVSPEASAGTSAGRPAEVRAVQDKTVPNHTEQQTTSSMVAQADAVRPALLALRQIEWYPFSLDRDGALLTTAVTSTPQIDLIGEVRRWALWCRSEPPRHPRAALAGWLRKAADFSTGDVPLAEPRALSAEEQSADVAYHANPTPDTWDALKAARATMRPISEALMTITASREAGSPGATPSNRGDV